MEFESKYKTFYWLENVVCEMTVILSKGRWVNYRGRVCTSSKPQESCARFTLCCEAVLKNTGKWLARVLTHWGWDKWPPFRRRQLEMHFRERKHLYFNWYFTVGQINNIFALVQIMVWRWPGDKPLSEPIMVNLLIHICVNWPQWVKKRST